MGISTQFAMSSQPSFAVGGDGRPELSMESFTKFERRRSSASSDKSTPHSPTSSDDSLLTNGGQKPGKRYACDVCDASFTMVGNLNRHKKSHLNHRPYTCNFCLRGFLRRTSYVEHLRLHTGEKPYVCEHCKQTFVRKKCHQMHIRKCFGHYNRNSFKRFSSVRSTADESVHSGDDFFKPSIESTEKTRLQLLSLQVTNPLINLYKSPTETGPSNMATTADDSPLDLTMSPSAASHGVPESSPPITHPAQSNGDNESCLTGSYTRSTSEQDYVIDARITKKNGCTSAEASGDADSPIDVFQQGHHNPATLPRGDRLLPCKHCQIFFVDYYMYIQHMALHDKNNPFLCTLCKKLCSNAQEFMMHH